MILRLPRHAEGYRVRVVIEGEGIQERSTYSAENTEIKRDYPGVDDANLDVSAWFIDNGGKQVGDLVVLQVAADQPPPLYDSLNPTNLDEDVREANEAIPVEDQDADKPELKSGESLDMGPELKLEISDEELAVEDRQEDGVETDESMVEETDPVVDESEMTDKYPSPSPPTQR